MEMKRDGGAELLPRLRLEGVKGRSWPPMPKVNSRALPA